MTEDQETIAALSEELQLLTEICSQQHEVLQARNQYVEELLRQLEGADVLKEVQLKHLCQEMLGLLASRMWNGKHSLEFNINNQDVANAYVHCIHNIWIALGMAGELEPNFIGERVIN